MKRVTFILSLSLLIVFTVSAQDGLNPDAPAANGDTTLATGFTPDPLVVEVVGGGSVRTLSTCLNNDGHTSAEPDFRLNWTSERPQSRLIFVVLADMPVGLIVRKPDGQFVCSGNQFSLLTPPAGRYEVWVRTITYDPDHLFNATLYISEAPLDDNTRDEAATEIGRVPALRYETLIMASGYTPNPYTQPLSGSGQNPNEFMCPGYFNFRVRQNLLWLNRDDAPLRFAYEGDAPAILAVRTATSQWLCSDAAGMMNPAVEVAESHTGLYQILIGVPSQGEAVSGTLSIEEGEASAAEEEGGIRLVTNVALLNPVLVGGEAEGDTLPTFGVLDSTVLDRAVVEPLAAGGTFNVETLDLPEECSGYIAAAPDYRVLWNEPAQMLRLAFIATVTDADTTLIVHLPDGSWQCNDNAADTTLDPALTIPGALTGTYDVWVAATQPGLMIPGGLVVSKVADIEAERERLRNEHQMVGQQFQNADQRASQLFNLLSTIMKTMNEMRMGMARNMGDDPEGIGRTLESLQDALDQALVNGEISDDVLHRLNVTLERAPQTLPPELNSAALTQLRALSDTIADSGFVVTILPTPVAVQPTPLQPTADLSVGSQGQVTQDGNNLNVRAQPGTANAIMGVLVSGLCVDIVGGPIESQGYTWWQIRGPRGISGWVADGDSEEVWLAPPTAACPSVSAGPGEAPSPTATLVGMMALPVAATTTPTPLSVQVPLVPLTQLNATAPPDHGDFAIVVSRFTNDPFRIYPTVAGGTVDTVSEPLPDNCVGWVTAQPDVRLDWQGSGGRLRAFFVSEGGPNRQDTTLIIRDPDGNWHCNNDSFGTLSPTVDISNITGEFNIWVGTIGPQGEQVTGTLFITRQDFNPTNIP